MSLPAQRASRATRPGSPAGQVAAPGWQRRPASALPRQAGIGLKPEHFRDVLAVRPDVGFFEVHAENYMVDGGPFHHFLGRIRNDYALSLHGVGLSIGAEDPLDEEHLDRLATLIARYEPASFSEHLAWSGHGGVFFNDLLPLVYDRTSLARVCDHIDRVQERLKRRMLIENPATYVEFATSTMTEVQFLRGVLKRTGCGLLLDVSNAYVSSLNHGRATSSCLDFIDDLPPDTVGEVHLAGFSCDRDAAGAPLLIDNHGAAVDEAVWRLYAGVIARLGPLPTLIERDNDVPPLRALLAEAQRAALVLALPSAGGAAGDGHDLPARLS